jgi:hypothetical protein
VEGRHETLVNKVSKLVNEYERLDRESRVGNREGMMKIQQLEHKMIALISAAAAIGVYCHGEGHKIERAVQAAIGDCA